MNYIQEALKVKGHLSQEEAEALKFYAENARHGIVEIGAYCGRSTIVLAGCSSVPVYSIDPHEAYTDNGVEFGPSDCQEFMANISRLDLGGNVKVFNWNSQPLVFAFKERFSDVLFIDGKHDIDSVRKDFKLWRFKVKRDGFILFHDAHLESVQTVIKEAKQLGYQTVQKVGTLQVIKYEETNEVKS